MLRDFIPTPREELLACELAARPLSTETPASLRCELQGGELCQLPSFSLIGLSPELEARPTPTPTPVESDIRSVSVSVRPPRKRTAAGDPNETWDPANVSGHVLVVDDDNDSLELMRQLLIKEGHTVLGVNSPLAALAALADESAEFDIVLTDVRMPEMSGIELCQRILNVRPDLFVIVNTGHADVNTAVAALRVGAFDFLTKPVNPQVLALHIAHALRQHELADEIGRLQRVSSAPPSGPPVDMVGSGSAMRRVYDLVTRVAASDASVLITGETGTGKELVARAIHLASGSRQGPFVAINCAAIPHELIESELFGHMKGAFTDAKLQRSGLLRQAEGGTIFLDEIGELPLDMQPKLLRALQERKVRPVGSDQEVPFNARVVSATNRNLETEVHERRFREDLYYRLAVVKIDLPRLRDRGSDVLEIASHCLRGIERRTERAAPRISSAVAEKLLSYQWPGNVRELENSMERAVALARFDELTVDDLPERIRAYQTDRFVVSADEDLELVKLDEIERRYIVRALSLLNGNKTRAAEILGIDRRTLYRKLQRWGLDETLGNP